jgi:hypothetical protein
MALLVDPSSRDEVYNWNKQHIASALEKEAQVPAELADEIASAVERRVLDSGLKRISTSLIRELVDNELFERGLGAGRVGSGCGHDHRPMRGNEGRVALLVSADRGAGGRFRLGRCAHRGELSRKALHASMQMKAVARTDRESTSRLPKRVPPQCREAPAADQASDQRV